MSNKNHISTLAANRTREGFATIRETDPVTGLNHLHVLDTKIEDVLNIDLFKDTIIKQTQTILSLKNETNFWKKYSIGLTTIVGISAVSYIGYKYVFSKEARNKRIAKRILKKVEKLNEQESN